MKGDTMRWLRERKGRFVMGLMLACLFVSVAAIAQEAKAPAPAPAQPAVAAAASTKNAENAFHLRKMIETGWPILSALLIMSIVSISIMIERTVVVKRAEQDARTFLPQIMEALRSGKPASAIAAICKNSEYPIAKALTVVVDEHGDREAMERASQREIQKKIGELEAKIPALGTIASTAPFVGLLGTVIGIIKAFQSIATHMGGGPEVVAAGVAEALITTAFGLFVAIPAVMGYNHFSHRISKFAAEMDVDISELVDRLNKSK